MFFATVAALSIAMVGVIAPSATAVATVGSDRAQIAQLEQKIAAQGARAETLVARSNAVEGQIAVLDLQIGHTHTHLATDRRAESAATADARQAAVDAYMNAGGGTSALAVFSDATSATDAVEQNDYLSAANSKLGDEVNTLVQDRTRTQATQHVLSTQQAQATATLHELAGARRAAASAIASDETLLRHAKGNLRSLLAADAARADAAQQASERALAHRPVVTPQPLPVDPPSSPSSPSPPSPPHSPSPGAYANPLRGVSALSPERIDQGVDYSGFGPIYAVGDGVVLSTVNGGWPGGTFIAYRLTDGPANGLVVFAAEDIQPSVQIGQTVNSNTVLGQVYGGPTGIETGWADPSGNGDTMARTYGQFSGSNSTAFGYNFSQLLQSLGAPGGVLQNNPPTGTLPSGWPKW